MKTYQYHSAKFGSDVQVTYNKHGLLSGFTVLNDVERIHSQLPEFTNYFKESDFLFSAKTHSLKITEVERKVTFEMFWEHYKEKNCGVTKAKIAWDRLSKADQIEAYDFVTAFKGILKLNDTGTPYATTYLNSKRWIR